MSLKERRTRSQSNGQGSVVSVSSKQTGVLPQANNAYTEESRWSLHRGFGAKLYYLPDAERAVLREGKLPKRAGENLCSRQQTAEITYID